MARKRIPDEEFKKLCSDKGVDFISREVDPNRIMIRYLPCKHESSVLITSLTKNNPFCWECYEDKIKKELLDIDLLYLAKLGNNTVSEKTKSSQRLVSCLKCGNFIFVLPKSIIQTKESICLQCKRNELDLACKERNLTLVNRKDNNHVEVIHNPCGARLTVQVSNLLRHNIRCDCKVKPKTKSFVYLCRIYLKGNNSVLKVGKSNNPYLRFQCFSESSVRVDFLSQIKLNSENEAYSVEKRLHKLLAEFSVQPEIVKDTISNGFTECYDEGQLVKIMEIFENEKRLVLNK